MMPDVADWRYSELGFIFRAEPEAKLKLTTVWPGTAYATLQGWAG
jgi:hypothetical protein